MTTDESRAGIVGTEIDLSLLIAAQHDHVLEHTTRRFVRYPRQFEAVSVQVDRVNVITLIAHTQTVAVTSRKAQHRLNHLHAVWIGRTIDRPAIEPAVSCIVFGKHHVKYVIGLRRSLT